MLNGKHLNKLELYNSKSEYNYYSHTYYLFILENNYFNL